MRENVTGTVTKVDSTHVCIQYADSDALLKRPPAPGEGYKLKW
ncbi:MAG: hypothetical protein ACLTGJ_09625 [Faecalibacterium prausnitzii]